MPTQATRTVSLGLAIMLELAPSAAAELNKKLLRSIGYLPAGGAFRREPFSRQHNRWQGPNGCRVARISGNALRLWGIRARTRNRGLETCGGLAIRLPRLDRLLRPRRNACTVCGRPLKFSGHSADRSTI